MFLVTLPTPQLTKSVFVELWDVDKTHDRLLPIVCAGVADSDCREDLSLSVLCVPVGLKSLPCKKGRTYKYADVGLYFVFFFNRFC